MAERPPKRGIARKPPHDPTPPHQAPHRTLAGSLASQANAKSRLRAHLEKGEVMTALCLIMRTDRSALAMVHTPSRDEFSRTDMENITEALLVAPQDVLQVTRINYIPAGFDL